MHNVQKKESLDDFKLPEPVVSKQSRMLDKLEQMKTLKNQAAAASTSNPTAAPAVPLSMPRNIFVVTADKKKPYRRLDAKYMSLFDQYLQEFLSFKKQELQNFENSTAMVLALGSELGVVKNVVEQVQLENDIESYQSNYISEDIEET